MAEKDPQEIIQDLTQQNQTLKTELENQIANFNLQNLEKQTEIDNLKNQINQLEQQITKLEEDLNEQSEEKTHIQENYQSFQQKYLSENTMLKDQNSTQENQIKQISTKMNEILNQLKTDTENHNQAMADQAEEYQKLQNLYDKQQQKYEEFAYLVEQPKPPVFKIFQNSNKIELYFIRDQSEIIKQNDLLKMTVRRVDQEWEKIFILENPKDYTINNVDPATKYELLFQGCKIINGQEKLTKKTDPITVQTLQSLDTLKTFNKKVKDRYNNYQMSKLQRYVNQRLINIMLLGGIGQGKTSVDNILVRYLQGKDAVLGFKSGSSGQSDTQQFYQVYLNKVHTILIQEFWGFSQNIENDNYDKIVKKILQKGATDSLTYDKRDNLSEMEKCLQNGDLNSQSHLGLIVINISKYQGEIVKECQKLIQLVKNLKIPLLIILTHFDVWYQNITHEPFKLQTVPEDLIQQCKDAFIQINRESRCDIIPDQNDIQVMICSQDGKCSPKAIKQLALRTIDNMMKMVQTYVQQLIKAKLCIIDQNNERICSLNFPNRTLNLQELEKEVSWNLQQMNIPNFSQFIFLDERNDRLPINKTSHTSMRVEDITFLYALDQDKDAQVTSVRIQLENSLSNELSKSQKSKSKQIMKDTDQQQQFLKSQSNNAKYSLSLNGDDEEEETQNNDNLEEEEEKNQVVVTKEFLNQMYSKTQKKINGKRQLELRKNLFFLQRNEDGKFELVTDDVIKYIYEKDLTITLTELIQIMDDQYQNENQIEEHVEQDQEEEESKDNSQHSTNSYSNQGRKPLTFYKERQFVRLLNVSKCKEGDTLEFEYISKEQLENMTLADILMGQNIITIESREQQEIEKSDNILLQNEDTKEYDLLKGKFTSNMAIKDIRNKFSKQLDILKTAQFLDKGGVTLKYNKDKKIIKYDNLQISECYDKKQQFIVLKYKTTQ